MTGFEGCNPKTSGTPCVRYIITPLHFASLFQGWSPQNLITHQTEILPSCNFRVLTSYPLITWRLKNAEEGETNIEGLILIKIVFYLWNWASENQKEMVLVAVVSEDGSGSHRTVLMYFEKTEESVVFVVCGTQCPCNFFL